MRKKFNRDVSGEVAMEEHQESGIKFGEHKKERKQSGEVSHQ